MDGIKKILATIGALWGAAGALLLLGYAVWRLTLISLDSLQYELTLLQWVLLILNVVFMAYSEGYKGFQKGYSPRVAARCLYIQQNPTFLNTLLAPLFVMGYFHTTKKRLIVTYSLTIMIIFFIVTLQYIAQPWRGIIDAGVVVGLAWGIISLCYFLIQAVFSSKFSCSPEIPAPESDRLLDATNSH